MPPSPRKAQLNPFYIVIPLLVLMVLGVAVAWESFRAKMEDAQRKGSGEAGLGVERPGAPGKERKSRELKTTETSPPPLPVPSEDEVTGLGKKKKKTVAAAKVYSPSERAWRSVKADYDRLEARNETTARKYRLRILAMEGRRDSISEASFVREASELGEMLKSELTKPENQ